eukprot:scaffold42518_cov63-Phaeocystis_antarctica.AAC.2
MWPASSNAAQTADWPRLAGARASLEHDLALREGSGAPAGRRLSHIAACHRAAGWPRLAKGRGRPKPALAPARCAGGRIGRRLSHLALHQMRCMMRWPSAVCERNPVRSLRFCSERPCAGSRSSARLNAPHDCTAGATAAVGGMAAGARHGCGCEAWTRVRERRGCEACLLVLLQPHPRDSLVAVT